MGWRSSEERAALGKAERTSAPREAQAELVPTDHDAVDLVVPGSGPATEPAAHPARADARLPFAFYRASAIVMA
jgi:hypothetical protein